MSGQQQHLEMSPHKLHDSNSRSQPMKRIRVHVLTEDDFEPPLKLSNADRFKIMGGDADLLYDYLGLREAVATARACGIESVCDPRDDEMCEKLRQREDVWQPRCSFKGDIVADADDSCGGSEIAGSSEAKGKIRSRGQVSSCKQTSTPGEKFSFRQTALGERDEAEFDDCDQDVRAGGETEKGNSFLCEIQGCKAEFSSLACYESHYHTSHHFVCHVCRRIFVSNFLLDIHLEENHDSYFHVLSPKIDMYQCLVETCDLKFRTADLRKEHVISIHKFPPGFSLHKPLKQKSQSEKSKTGFSRSKKNKNKNRNNARQDNHCDMEEDVRDVIAHKNSQEHGMQRVSNDGDEQIVSSDKNENGFETSSSINIDGSSLKGKLSRENNRSTSRKGRGKGGGVNLSRSTNFKTREDDTQCAGGMDIDFTDTTKVEPNDNVGRGKGRGAPKKRGGESVPSAICFGRGSQRAFQHRGGSRGRHWHQAHRPVGDTNVDLERMDFGDMAESLVDSG